MNNARNILFLLFIILNISEVVGASTHPRLLFSQSDIDNNSIWNNISANTTLMKFYDYYYLDTWDHRTWTLNSRNYYHYAADMSFIAIVDKNIDANDRNLLKINALSQLSTIYNQAIALKNDDLTVSAAVIHIALTYDMLYNELSSSDKCAIASNIKTLVDILIDKFFIFNTVEMHFEQKSNITLYGNNHLFNCAAGIGIGAIAIKGDALNANDVFSSEEAWPYIEITNSWLILLDHNMFAVDGSNYEGVFFGIFSMSPMIAYFEMLRRDEPSLDFFPNLNIKNSIEWLVLELVPAPARHSPISESLFDFNNINASYNWKDYTDGADSRTISLFAALGGIYNSYSASGAATWIFNHHMNIFDYYSLDMENYFSSNSILAIIKYVNNSPVSLEDIIEKRKFFNGRGLIVRDGFADEDALFSFEINRNYNIETGKCCWRWDEDDNNSFTFYAYGDRWAIDNGKKTSSGIHEEKSDRHNTILVDGNKKPYIDNLDQQVADWYDYQYFGEIYYVTSDITSSWLKKIDPDDNIEGTGTEIFFNSHPRYDTCQTYATFDKDRRHIQFIPKEDVIPPYVIIFDDIQQNDATMHDYSFLLNTGQGNTVIYDGICKKAQITNQTNTRIAELYFKSDASSDIFSTDTIDPITDDPHLRLKYTVNNVINPHFHTILIPSSSIMTSVSNLFYIDLIEDLAEVGSVALIDFGQVIDYSIFSFRRAVNDGSYSLYGYTEPNAGINGVPGIMGYARYDKSSNEFTKYMLSRGSFLKVNNDDLIMIGGPDSGQNPNRTARILLNNHIINVFKVSGNGRYSYKLYGKDVNEFRIYQMPQTFTKFNDYNYLNNGKTIYNFHAHKINDEKLEILWSCNESHDATIYIWEEGQPQILNYEQEKNLSAGNHSKVLNLDATKNWNFRIEGLMALDNYLDLTNIFSLDQCIFKCKLYLEGPYSSDGFMSTVLQAINVIPTSSPYSEDPVECSHLPDFAVDWVLIQLKSEPSGPIVASCSAILRRDGQLIDINGNDIIALNAFPGEYYVVIKHRNHVSIMTSSPFLLSFTNPANIDFTIGIDKYYARSSAKHLEEAIWGVCGGDFNADGLITTKDYVLWYIDWGNQDSGYWNVDFNLDGKIELIDYYLWKYNAKSGISSYINK